MLTTKGCVWALRVLADDLKPNDVAKRWFKESANKIEHLEQRIQRWHDILTPLMPSDLKSWHENNPDELPEVTAWVIESQRQRIAELETENDSLRADLLLWQEKEVKP
jgi:hypothetical protein